MVNLYLFRSTPVNITNLPQFCFMISRINESIDPCIPKLSYGCFLDVNLGSFPKAISPTDPSKNVRLIKWSQQKDLVEWLDDHMNVLSEENKIQTLGNYDDDQLLFLKNRYRDKAFVVTISYQDHETYSLLLRYLAKSHLRKQDLGLIALTDFDQKLRESNINLTKYYTNAFEEQNLLPESLIPGGDYDIPVSSFFDRDEFFQHLCKLDVTITNEVIEYYDAWHSAYEKFFKD